MVGHTLVTLAAPKDHQCFTRARTGRETSRGPPQCQVLSGSRNSVALWCGNDLTGNPATATGHARRHS
jgi:hypothetical protein